MLRVMSLSLAVSLAIDIGIASAAQDTGGTGPKLFSINGAVKAVSTSSLTLEVGNHEIVVIGADPSTRVVAKGARASDLLYREGGRKLPDLIKAGNRVTVTYRRSGRAAHAVEIRVVQK